MIHVFAGPTLPSLPPSLAASGVRLRPPVGHGDLFDPGIHSGDTAVIIDGVYHQAPALRHKEIIAAIGRGVTVIGAASIGALRAAELAPYGMRGVGHIYAAYACAELEGDDEVAVGQSPDGEFGALTWPVVNLRQVLRLAVTAGILDSERAVRLLKALRAIYYPQRTWSAVRAVCRRQGEAAFTEWLTARLAHDRHFGDLKRADALEAVYRALDGGRPSRAAAGHALVWETAYFQRWSNALTRACVDGVTLSTEDRLIYQQVFDPGFAKTWTAFLEHRSLHPADGSPGLPLEARLAQVAGGDLPADAVFHPPVDLRDEPTVAQLLAGETEEDRHAVARYAATLAEERRTRPGFTVAAVRDDLTRWLLVRVWQCAKHDFDAEASARGLGTGARAVAAAKRLVPGLLHEMRERTEKTEAAHAR